MDGFLVVAAFVVLFCLGFPVVLAIGLPCLAYVFIKDLPIDLVAQRMLYSLDSFPLVAVPVFLFVGSLMTSTGISRYIYRFADTAVGRLPGGLAQVNIFGSLIFSGMSGSALADIGGIGRIEIDAMRAKGFNVPFAAAVTSSSAIIGPIFPPSIPLIIYGTVTGASVLQLLLGGIVPGLLCTAMLMLMAGWLAKRRNFPRAERWPTARELWRDFWPAAPAIAAPVAAIAAAAVVVLLAEPSRDTEVASSRPPAAQGLAIVPRPVGPAAAELVASAGPQGYHLARRLRGAGHPHSRSLAAHFERPAEAIAVAWQGR